MEACLLQAAHTLLCNSLPALPDTGLVSDLWQRALALSYATELRTERSGRAAELAQSASDFYADITRLHAPSLGSGFKVYDSGGGLHYSKITSALQRLNTRCAWWLRRGQGKLLSILRLVKALFTFEGTGLYRVEAGTAFREEIVIPERVRRAPLIYLWGFFWGLYRRGIFK